MILVGLMYWLYWSYDPELLFLWISLNIMVITMLGALTVEFLKEACLEREKIRKELVKKLESLDIEEGKLYGDN